MRKKSLQVGYAPWGWAWWFGSSQMEAQNPRVISGDVATGLLKGFSEKVGGEGNGPDAWGEIGAGVAHFYPYH